MIPKAYLIHILAAEELYQAGEYDSAEIEYIKLIDLMENTSAVDAYLVAKAVLARLLIHLHRDDVQAAGELWDTEREASLWGLGIYLLDEGLQLSEGDIALYRLITALLFSLGAEEREDAAGKVEYRMKEVLVYAAEHDGELLVGALSNWRHYLAFIYEDAEIPAARTAILDEAAKLLEEGIPDYPISFPYPERMAESSE